MSAKDPEGDNLARYRAKRDFSKTPEPDEPASASRGRSRKSKGRATPTARFVIQKHWATRLHYDFRLEIDGVMKSWAVPKGPSLDPAVKRMAVHVEDHPIAYNDFEGTIPKGEYGAGKVIIWDRGHWTSEGDPLEAYRAGKLKVHLEGEKLRGKWALIRMRSRSDDKDDAWLLIKEKDEHTRPQDEYDVTEALPHSVAGSQVGSLEEKPAGGRDRAGKNAAEITVGKSAGRKSKSAMPDGKGETMMPDGKGETAMPDVLEPQLATRVSAAPRGDEWLYELKYDGYRILARRQADRLQLFTRRGHDWTDRLSTLALRMQLQPMPDGWYDGEIVVLDADGRPDFQALQNAFEPAGGWNRSKQGKSAAGKSTADSIESAVTYFLFDLLWVDGQDLRQEALEVRRSRLEEILEKIDEPALRLSEAYDVKPQDMLASACHLGLEGIIGKQRSSAYVSGRSGHWIKLKCGERQEFVIGGYTDPKGARSGLGSLLLGYYDEEGLLQYAGNVGSGFTESSLADVYDRLQAIEQKQPAFADPPKVAGVHWTRPTLSAEVSFSQWTQSGRIRHAVFRGLREDKPARLMKKEHSHTISNPERVIDKKSGTRKGDVAVYYERVAPLILPHLEDRPVSLLRAPDGIAGELFFQKHMATENLSGIAELDPALDPGHDPLVVIKNAGGLAEAAQLNAIEFHSWNAVSTRIDRPDRITFDLDPGEGVKWPAIQEAAILLRNFLQELGLPTFVKTSGGKGLHVVVPITRRYDWDTAKGFSQAVVQHMAQVLPKRFSAKSGPRNRVGKIFIDYLRNGFGATTVSAWSLRARPGMGVSVPISWDEVETIGSGDHWTIVNIDERIDVGNEPWSEYGESATALGSAMKRLGYRK